MRPSAFLYIRRWHGRVVKKGRAGNGFFKVLSFDIKEKKGHTRSTNVVNLVERHISPSATTLSLSLSLILYENAVRTWPIECHGAELVCNMATTMTHFNDASGLRNGALRRQWHKWRTNQLRVKLHDVRLKLEYFEFEQRFMGAG